jgi:hypothetical protein
VHVFTRSYERFCMRDVAARRFSLLYLLFSSLLPLRPCEYLQSIVSLHKYYSLPIRPRFRSQHWAQVEHFKCGGSTACVSSIDYPMKFADLIPRFSASSPSGSSSLCSGTYPCRAYTLISPIHPARARDSLESSRTKVRTAICSDTITTPLSPSVCEYTCITNTRSSNTRSKVISGSMHCGKRVGDRSTSLSFGGR